MLTTSLSQYLYYGTLKNNMVPLLLLLLLLLLILHLLYEFDYGENMVKVSQNQLAIGNTSQKKK